MTLVILISYFNMKRGIAVKKTIKTLSGLFILFTCTHAHAQLAWDDWVAELRTEALAKGISAEIFDQAFEGLTPMASIIHLDKGQPEKRITYDDYQKSRIDNYRITLGEKKYQEHSATLSDIQNKFGVDPCFVMSFWGLESSYGNYLGNFPVIRALATLAYDPRRAEQFRKEVFIALEILQEGHIDQAHFKGEWAGASGHSQFLPSSWKKFAVDFDGDGRKNIWTSEPDALASIANYLVGNGWTPGEPWGYEVNVPEGFDESLMSNTIKKSVSEWAAMGVTLTNGQSLTNSNAQASIIQPYGGPHLLVLNNFNVIMKYNHSTYYAGSISYLADKICQRR